MRKLILLGALVFGTTLVFAATAAPYVPVSDDQVIERLPEKNDPSLRELRKLRIALKQDPGDLAAAVKLARRAVEAARETGDPRFLGQAQSALMPWWSLTDPPAPALLLRATVKQSNHDFDGALADLDRLIEQYPANGQALLTRATVLTVVGNYSAALADCGRIARLTAPLVVAGCLASPRSLSGEAAQAYDALTASLARAGNADPALREWALTLAAEIAERRGEFAAAEAHYRSALALDPRDPYLIAAYCDYLLDRDRPAEVALLIGGQTRNDNLLLRLALAEARMPDAKAAFDAHRQDLADRFEAARQRSDALHRREEARFRLSIEHDATSALRLARANWRVQREPADLRVLLEAATVAGDAATLREVATWTAAHRLEYVALAATEKVR